MGKNLQTSLLHTGDGQFYKRANKSSSVPEVLPVYRTSVFAFDDVPSVDRIYEGEDDGYIYSRIKHPNTEAVSEIIAAADETEAALVFSSGMAAITLSILSVVKQGDHIISSPVLYGGVHDFLENELARFGVSVTFVDFIHENIADFIRPETKLIYTESISNPLMEVPDMAAAAKVAHEHGLLFFVDNTFATPVVVKPALLGADVVLYSATKYLGGHSDIVAGAAAGRQEIIDKIHKTLTLYGAVLGAEDSWLLARSLRTLSLRVTAHSRNALQVAAFLEKHPKIEKVFYPGLESSPSHKRAKAQFAPGLFGGMLSFNLRGGEQEAATVIRELSTIKYVPSLAGTATTLSYAAKTSHRSYSPADLAAVGITLGQLRLSVGLEQVEDIISELNDTLAKI